MTEAAGHASSWAEVHDRLAPGDEARNAYLAAKLSHLKERKRRLLARLSGKTVAEVGKVEWWERARAVEKEQARKVRPPNSAREILEQSARICRAYLGDQTITEIAEAHNINVRQVFRIVKAAGLPSRINHRRDRSKTSKYRGVYKVRRLFTKGKVWRASIRRSQTKTEWLGRFHTEEEAARAFDAAVKHYKLNPNRLNFPEE